MIITTNINYFLDDQKELQGCVIQKFPEKDWKLSPCPQGLEHVSCIIIKQFSFH